MCSDLIKIKDKYGERMMQLCRSLFPTILEEDGKLFDLLSSNFGYSKNLYDDIVNNLLVDKFKNYIYSLIPCGNEEIEEILKTPFELLDEAGYTLYECNNEEDIQQFKKYYHPGEKLCTFRGGRLDYCYVFFAVKKNVNEIKRDDFLNPKRQDAYGTSVISIQFTRGKNNTLSIKNRYNHKVTNPDSTYSNNLDNIISGLTKSFEKFYNLNVNQNSFVEFEIPGYVKANDGRFYKYNYEINNIYYCPDNVIIDNFEVIDDYLEKEKYIVMDYFVLDLVEKKISLYDNYIRDSLELELDNIKKIEINKQKDTGNRVLKIIFEDGTYVTIEIDKCNRMISYSDNNILNIGDNFLCKNIYLEKINIPNVLTIGSNFLKENRGLKSICADKLLEVGNYFLSVNEKIDNVNLPNIFRVGNYFIYNGKSIEFINMPNLQLVENYFLSENKLLEEINLPNLIYVGDCFLYYNRIVKNVMLPNLVNVGDSFLSGNKSIEKLYLPNLRQVRDNFLFCNISLNEFNAENLESVGNNFMLANRSIIDIYLPRLKNVGTKFLYKNNSLLKLEVPELYQTGGYFMYDNNSLTFLYAPKLKIVGKCFLYVNNVLDQVDLSSLEQYGKCFCNSNKGIKKRVLEL